MGVLLPIILEKILIPELARWLELRRTAGLPLPTAEEILAKLDADATTILNAGEAFLRKHGAIPG